MVTWVRFYRSGYPTPLNLRPSELGLCVRDRQDRWRLTSRTARRSANPRVRTDLERGECSVLGSIVGA